MHIHIFSATTRRQIHAYVFSALARHVTLPARALRNAFGAKTMHAAGSVALNEAHISITKRP